MERPPDSTLPLSVHRAFVIQFQAETHRVTGQLAGRVQHISSHATATFDSVDDLLVFIHQVLRGSQAAPTKEKVDIEKR